jgi:serine phosphatase RsbU (regulator of sigma subunit)
MQDPSAEIKNLLDRIAALEGEKSRAEEKNRKLWQMSETVHIERKKIEETNVLLAAEKQKLEQEKAKLDDRVKKLWQQSMSIHQEKERINQLRMVVEEQHKSVTESIEYARIIQHSILPDENEIRHHLPGLFILYQPRDVVSGDFYWFHPMDENRALLAIADCTGHGVPGAFMSMIGNTLLNQIVKEKGITAPSAILNELDNSIRITLKQDRTENASRDGMDIAVLLIDRTDNSLHFSGANRPCWIFRGKERDFFEQKANKFAIGGWNFGEEKEFQEHHLSFQSGDQVYLSSDGYADQFGGEKGKKFMTGNMQNLLKEISLLEPDAQREELMKAHLSWRKHMPQVDDICVAGIRL